MNAREIILSGKCPRPFRTDDNRYVWIIAVDSAGEQVVYQTSAGTYSEKRLDAFVHKYGKAIESSLAKVDTSA